MYRKRATLLTINCSMASFFTKVRTPRNSFASLKRNLSTAAERSYYQNPRSGSNEDNIAEYQQNPSGPQTHFDLHHKSYNGYSQDSRFIGNTEQNPDGLYRGNTRIDTQHNPVGQNVNFLSGYGTESYKSEFQGYPIVQNGSNFQNTMGQNGNFRGNYGGYSEQLGQNSSGYNNTENWGQFQQSGSDHYSGNSGVPQQKSSNYFWENTITNQQKPENYFSGNTRTIQHYPSNYSGSKNSMNSQSPGHYYPESNTINQNGTGARYASTGGMHRQRTSGYIGDSVGTPNSYVEYNQYPTGSYNANAGNYPNNSNVSEGGMIVSQVSSNLKADESVEAVDGGQYSGTVEELDGFCKEGKLKEVVKLLGLLESQHIQVGLPRYFMLMKACGEAKAPQEAKYVHEHLMRSFCIPEVSTYNQILDMYGKCGSMDDAFAVFDKMPQRNLTSWDTMITWLAKNGHGEEAIELFTQFKEVGLKPDGKMFIGVFSACSALGDVIEGMLHFESMSKDYGIVPLMEHYVSVVDMLGSTGYLDEALEFIEKMPLEPSIDVWETLMNLSRVYGNVELGDRCAELVELMDPSRLDEQSKAGLIPVKASDLAKEKEKKKQASENLLAVRSRIHEYRAGDKSHPEADKIYAQLRGMKEQMKEAGYVPETRFVLHDIEQEGKEEALLAHSERLAVAFGLMSSPVRSPMRIIKNLRVCGDCHSALKIISKLVGRELIIRDAKRFHHFKDGLCSCRDYW